MRVGVYHHLRDDDYFITHNHPFNFFLSTFRFYGEPREQYYNQQIALIDQMIDMGYEVYVVIGLAQPPKPLDEMRGNALHLMEWATKSKAVKYVLSEEYEKNHPPWPQMYEVKKAVKNAHPNKLIYQWYRGSPHDLDKAIDEGVTLMDGVIINAYEFKHALWGATLQYYLDHMHLVGCKELLACCYFADEAHVHFTKANYDFIRPGLPDDPYNQLGLNQVQICEEMDVDVAVYANDGGGMTWRSTNHSSNAYRIWGEAWKLAEKHNIPVDPTEPNGTGEVPIIVTTTELPVKITIKIEKGGD